jgi:hypothetical protein
MRSTSNLLEKIENLLKAVGYNVRYEKGNFKGGYCVLENKQLVVVNKFYPLEGRINTLAEVVNNLSLEMAGFQGILNEEQLKLVLKLQERVEKEKQASQKKEETSKSKAA